MKHTTARAPMLVMRHLVNTELETKERIAVQAFAKGFATTYHYDVLLGMNNILILGGSSSKERTYAVQYAQDVVGKALLGIKARYEKTNKLGCSASELNVLKKFVEFNREFWIRQPTELFVLACDEYAKFRAECLAKEVA